MKTIITYIISNIDKALAFEWVALSLDKNKFDLNFILLNPTSSELENFLKENQVKVTRIPYNGKKNIISALFATYKILKKNKSQVIHAHLFEASIIGLTAAFLLRIKKRIYTRHHSDLHHVYHPHMVKYDKYINKLSTDIIAISPIVENILIENENVSLDKVHLVPHGFQLTEFNNNKFINIAKLKQKYNPMDNKPVIGVISRYTEWKGIQYVIPAFKNLLIHYPNALLILANANGNYKTEIKKLLSTIPTQNYVEIAFEKDIFSLYKLFDVFVHVPITTKSEAFGQTYVEALASGVPSIFTLSGIANEFIKDRYNARVVPWKDSNQIFEAVKEIIDDKELSNSIIANGKSSVMELFSLNKMMNSLESIYICNL